MKNTEISKALKFEVFWEAGIRRIPTLMKYIKISQATAYRYAEQMTQQQHIERKKGSGGKNATVKRMKNKVIQKMKNTKKSLHLRRVAKETGVSRETVRKILKNEDWRFKKLRRKKLTLKQRSEREKFCNLLLSRLHDVPFIIWTDETSFWLNKSRPRYAWVCQEYEDTDDPFEGSQCS